METEITKSFTRDEIMDMDENDLKKLVDFVYQAGGVVKGTALVRKKDGTVRYDDPKLKGTYNEG